ncbi:MAG: hypothetical protein A2270_06225 [Elusimicrobia bacterium RIFOXYA12_FULL_51_18]|nr:MAG: hypothetical protein A2270_06225 [Elusimicrobia bacterium RIFOXYA12_FULL_51_18]OGS32678.1 MAG: hypothetical protein A2218_11500 [Elusimicrobia bacterium RIFOXYA2_FULL_53_38]
MKKINILIESAFLVIIFQLLTVSAHDMSDGPLDLDKDSIPHISADFYRDSKNAMLNYSLPEPGPERAAPSGSIKIISYGDDFRIFLAKAENADRETQVNAWIELSNKLPPGLGNSIFHTNSQGLEAAVKEALPGYMSKMPEIREETLYLFDVGPTAIQNTYYRFRKVFSDFTEGATAYIFPSMFRRGISAAPTEKAILFGPDTMVSMGLTEKAFTIGTAHELFHNYEYFASSGKKMNTFAAALWSDGAANYVSGLINPEASQADILLDSVLSERCSDAAFVKDLARRYRSILDKSFREADNAAINEEWFGSTGVSTLQNPTRKAYCLGLQVIKKLVPAYNIPVMLTWPEPKLVKIMDKTLAEMSAD